MSERESQTWIHSVGERVRIHPACDWFMRGERYATVVGPGPAGRLKVEGDSRRVFTIRPQDVLEVLEPERGASCENSPACAARGCADCERSYGPQRR